MNSWQPEQRWMDLAVAEARRCRSETASPKPLVGAVVVRDGELLGQAFRGELAPGEHAEFTLLERKLEKANLEGATLYTTLEPCTTRKHPKVPCAKRIAERNIRHVCIGTLDPNPNIQGNGYWTLQHAGVAVSLFSDSHAKGLQAINRDFLRHIRRRRIKWARIALIVGIVVVAAVLSRDYLLPEPRIRFAVSSPSAVIGKAGVRHSGQPLSEPLKLDVVLVNEGRRAGGSFHLEIFFSPAVQVLRVVHGSFNPQSKVVVFDGRDQPLLRAIGNSIGSVEIRIPKQEGRMPIAFYHLAGDFDPSAGVVHYDATADAYVIQSVSPSATPQAWNDHVLSWNARSWIGKIPEIWRITDQHQPQMIAALDAHVFWVVNPKESRTSIMAATLRGQDVHPVASSGHAPGSLAAENGALFWTEPTSGKVMRATPVNKEWSQVLVDTIVSRQEHPRGLAVSDDIVYWTTDSGLIGRIRLSDRQPSVFAKRENLVHSIVVHQSQVCWGEQATRADDPRGLGFVLCQSEGGKPAIVFNANEIPLALATDGSSLYVGTRDVGGSISYGRIWRVANGRTSVVADGQPVVTMLRVQGTTLIWVCPDGDVRGIVGDDRTVRVLAAKQPYPYGVTISGRTVVWTNQGGAGGLTGSIAAIDLPQ